MLSLATLTLLLPMLHAADIIPYNFELQSKIATGKMTAADDQLAFAFTVDRTGVNFLITNKTESTARLKWDDSALIDWTGKSAGVFGKNCKMMAITQPKPPLVIPAGAKAMDFFVPVDLVAYDDGWKVTPLIHPALGKDLDGKVIRILMAFEIDGKAKEYTFAFKMTAW